MLKKKGAFSYFKIAFLILTWILVQIGKIPLFFLNLASITAGGIISAILSKPVKIALGVFIISAILSISYFLITIARDLPSPERLNTLEGPQTTFFYDRNGVLLYKLYEGRNRTLVKLNSLPPYLIKATIAIEDKHFYNHPGVDFFAILRALIANLQNERIQGGSTITQQLIKNTLLSSERTFQRKAKEIFLAYWSEKIYTKEQILQMYFNEAPYGGTAWGIEAAAETYFNKKVSELSLGESAFLAGLPASPTEYSPYGPYPQRSKRRQKEVLQRMVEDGYINSQEAKKAYEDSLYFKPPTNEILAPHFVMYVRSELAKKYGEKVVSQGGLQVTTTIDTNIQKMAEEVVSEEVGKLKSLNVSNGAALITDAKTGEILAMVGSKDYYDPKIGNYNVTLALRQPGSSIKPITYAAAFKKGYSPGTILLDTPTTFKNAWEVYTPINYDGKFHGAVTIRTALGSSYNVPAVKMLYMIGIPEMIQTARDLGITTFENPSRYGWSLTLGGGEIKMIDMITAYGTFAQMGVRKEATGILKVIDSEGKVLEDNSERAGERVLSSGIAYLITHILMDNSARSPAFGQSSLLNIANHQVAVKTGTSDNKRDNWTFGYSPEFVVGVWVGNNDNAPMNPILTSGVTGAAPIWNKLMTILLKDRQFMAFERPSDIAEAMVDGKKDLVLVGSTPKSVVGRNLKKVKDETTSQEKEIITFTDPFTTYTPESGKNP